MVKFWVVFAPPSRPQEGKDHEIHNFFPLTHRCFVPKLVEIGAAVSEKKLKMFTC
jgi:hypothetical protein